MKAVSHLPQGYEDLLAVDLQKDKKLALSVNILAFVIAVLLAVPMCFVVPISTLFDMSAGFGPYLLRFAALFVFLIVYMVLHELVHGVAMKLCGTKKIRYGFTGMYAFACSDDYYDKRSYIFIALAPLALWGVVLAVLTAVVPVQWFWVVYFLQIINLSGAAGDLYVTVRFSRLPADILIRDSGMGMTVYTQRR